MNHYFSLKRLSFLVIIVMALAVAVEAQGVRPWMVSLYGGTGTIHGDSNELTGAARVHRVLRGDWLWFDTGYTHRLKSRDSFQTLDAGMELRGCVTSGCVLAAYVGGGGGVLGESDFVGEMFRGNGGIEFNLGQRNALRFGFQVGTHGGQSGPNLIMLGFGHRFGTR